MRLWRMAAGRRVSGQACVSAATRCQRGSAVGRSYLHRASGTFRWPSPVRRGLVPCGTRPATIRVGEPGGPNLACLPKGCAAGGAVDFCWVRRGGAWHSKRLLSKQLRKATEPARCRRYKKEMTKSIHVGGRPVWAEISLRAILRNLEIIREHVNRGASLQTLGAESARGRQKQIPRLRSG